MPQNLGEVSVFNNSLEYMEVVRKEWNTDSAPGTQGTSRIIFTLELHYGYQLILYDTSVNWGPKIIK